MKIVMSAASVMMLSLLTHVGVSAAADDATLLRLFLRDGTSLVSYGEFARIADRVIFSLPTSTASNPTLQLVNIPADRVDWERTDRYADAARAARYASTLAEGDYVELSNRVATALNEVAFMNDPARRLAIVEGARKTLAEWPQNHYNYRSNDVRQMLTLLDEAIADLRSSAGGSRFDLSLVAVTPPPPSPEPLLPPPTPIESIDQLLAAAAVTDSPVEQRELLDTALTRLRADELSLPREWAATTRARARGALDANLRVERSYQALVRQVTAQADERARAADVGGIRRVLEGLRRSDAALGGRRPDAVNAAIAAIDASLDAARRLQTERDRWARRAPVLRQYEAAMGAPLSLFRTLDGHLDDIKELAGSTPAALALVQRQVDRALQLMTGVVPPDECRAAHALLLSAAHLATSAARIRRDAVVAGDLARAWDASSAAAGAIMLGEKARSEIRTLVNRPQLP